MPAMPSRSLLFALAGLALAAFAGGCAAPDDKFAPACPGLALVPDAADISRFDGHGLDVTNLIVRGRIDAVPAACKNGDKGSVVATLHVDAEFTRGPAGARGIDPITYFVGLTRGDAVVNEQDFAFTPGFAANVDQASVHGEDIELVLPVSKTSSAAAYRIYVGFRLTPDQLAYNRTHARP